MLREMFFCLLESHSCQIAEGVINLRAPGLLPSRTEATDAEQSQPKGSQTMPPGFDAAATWVSIKSSGFWFRCAADSLLGL